MTETESLLRHARSVEITMRALARKHGEDEVEWGVTGLLHDADYEKWPENHPHRIVSRLRDMGEDKIAHAISAHYTIWGVSYDTLLSKGLLAADELTGFIVACCLVRPDGVHSLKSKSVKKKFKDKKFAAKVDREEITRALEIYEVEFSEHVDFLIGALREHADELQIGGRG